MPIKRIIKKYANRRLYDTELRHYITIADVRDLVMRGVPVQVVDTANDAEITRSILLQIMLDEQADGEPLFSANMLAQSIRFYGGTPQGVFARYVEQALDAFAAQHKQLAANWSETPSDATDRMTQRNVTLWAEARETFLRAARLEPSASTRWGSDGGESGHDAGDDEARADAAPAHQ